jgi:hypothetical protein
VYPWFSADVLLTIHEILCLLHVHLCRTCIRRYELPRFRSGRGIAALVVGTTEHVLVTVPRLSFMPTSAVSYSRGRSRNEWEEVSNSEAGVCTAVLQRLLTASFVLGCCMDPGCLVHAVEVIHAQRWPAQPLLRCVRMPHVMNIFNVTPLYETATWFIAAADWRGWLFVCVHGAGHEPHAPGSHRICTEEGALLTSFTTSCILLACADHVCTSIHQVGETVAAAFCQPG